MTRRLLTGGAENGSMFFVLPGDCLDRRAFALCAWLLLKQMVAHYFEILRGFARYQGG
jgi:hypothetical protein